MGRRFSFGAVWVAVLGVVAAGCTSSEEIADDSPDAPMQPDLDGALEAYERAVDHAGCRGIELFTTVDKQDVTSFVPDGFAPSDPALAIVGVYLCGPEEEVAVRGFVAIQVTPADNKLISDTATNYFWQPEHFLGNDTTVTEAFVEARAVVTPVEVWVNITATAADFTITAWNASYRFVGTAVGVPGTASTLAPHLPAFREYSPGRGGYAYIDAGFAAEDGATTAIAGTLTVTGSGPGAALFGESSQRSGLAFTDYEYSDAAIGFLPWP